MPSLKIKVPHGLGVEEASNRLKSLMEKIMAKYGDQVKDVSQTWLSDHALQFGFKTMGQKIGGVVDVEQENVNVDLSLPFAAMMVKGKIESTIREQIEKALA